MVECSANLHGLVAFFLKRNMVTVNMQSPIKILGTTPPSLLFEPCRNLTDTFTGHLLKVTGYSLLINIYDLKYYLPFLCIRTSYSTQ